MITYLGSKYLRNGDDENMPNLHKRGAYMKKFVDDDEGYLNWIHKNPAGFVVNSYRKPNSRYLILHHANCWTISSPKRINWTTTGYIKICSLDRMELEKWAQKEVGGSLWQCQICNP